MIPFKYYIQIYKRYLNLYIQNKKQNIKDWFSKPREERYKYFNPDNEKEEVDFSRNIVSNVVFGRWFQVGTTASNKMWCKDVNRQMHYTKGRLRIINNTLNSTFSTPFKNFYLTKNTNKSVEELSIEINEYTRKILLYFLLSLPIIFIATILFTGGPLVSYDYVMQSSKTATVSGFNKMDDITFVAIIIAVIGIYVVITLLVSILFNILMFISLWKFINKNAYITKLQLC